MFEIKHNQRVPLLKGIVQMNALFFFFFLCNIFRKVTIFHRPQRNYEVADGENYLFRSGGRYIGNEQVKILDEKSLSQAHRYHYNKKNWFRTVSNAIKDC